MSSASFLRKLSALAASIGAAASLQAAQPAAKASSDAQHPTTASHTDKHTLERESLIYTYAPLNLDFEGDFPFLYNDHGAIAAPGGVHLNPNVTLKLWKLVPINPNTSVTVKSYISSVRRDMAEMAEGRLPKKFQKLYTLQQEDVRIADLNIDTLPKQEDKTHTGVVYMMSAADRNLYHLQAIREHLHRVEKSFPSVDAFYNMPFVLQVVALDLGYTRKLEGMKCGRAILRLNLDAQNPEFPNKTNRQVLKDEAYTSSKEKDARRHILRKALVDAEKLLPNDLPAAYATLLQNLPAGENKLADLGYAVMVVNANQNLQKNNQQLIFTGGSNGLTE